MSTTSTSTSTPGINNKQIFVKGLPAETTNEDLENYFSEIGPLKRCFIVPKLNEKNEKVCSGIAYVWYALSEHAEIAIKQKNNKQFKSKIIHVSIAKEKLAKEKKGGKKNNKEGDSEDSNNTTTTTAIPEQSIVKQYNTKKEFAVVVNNLVSDKDIVSKFLSLRKEIIKAVYSIPHSNDAIRIVCENEDNLKQVVTKLAKNKENNGKKVLFAVENDNLKSNELIIRNLSFNTNIQFLFNKFSSYGTLVLVKVPTKPGTNTPRGFAFLTFKEKESSTKVIAECNGEKIHSRQIVIDWAIKQNDYQQLQFDKQQQQKKDTEKLNKIGEDNNDDDEEEESDEKKDDEEEESDEGSDEEESVKGEDNEDGDDEDDDDEEMEDDEDEEMEDGDDDEDDDDDDDEDKPDIKKKMEIDHTRNKKEVEELKTLFIRNLAFDTKEEDLGAKFETFGKLVFCRLVLDKITSKPTGKAFVKYYEQESAKRAMEACSSTPLYDLSLEEKINKNSAKDKKEKKKNSLSVSSLLQGGLMMDGRILVVTYAVDHKQATAFKEKKVDNVDKKNRHLLNIGKIIQNSAEGKELDEKDWQMRNQADRENQTKLKVNPNYYVSPTRLCLRNLPLHVTDSILKSACTKILKEANIKDKIIFSKVACDAERITASTGKPKSKGYAFVECSSHIAALELLHKTNNNTKVFFSSSNVKSKDQRVFTQFAVEDARAVKKQKEYLDKQAKKQQQQKIERSIIKKQQKDGVVASTEEGGDAVVEDEKKQSRGQRQREKKRDRREKLTAQGIDVDELQKQKELQAQKKQLLKEMKEKNLKKPKVTQQQQEKLIKQHKKQISNNNSNNNSSSNNRVYNNRNNNSSSNNTNVNRPLHTSTTIPRDPNHPANLKPSTTAPKRKLPEEFDQLANNYIKSQTAQTALPTGGAAAIKKKKWFH